MVKQKEITATTIAAIPAAFVAGYHAGRIIAGVCQNKDRQ